MSKKEATENVSLIEGKEVKVVKTPEVEEEAVENPNLEFYNFWRTPPQEVLSDFTNRFAGTNIKPQWRVKVLTAIFGPCGIGWYVKPLRDWTETYGDEVKVFVEINLFVKDPKTGEWSMPIFGTGGNSIVNQYRYVSDEGYKMATTDAISYACQQLGIAGDVYMGHEITKYDDDTANLGKKRYENSTKEEDEGTSAPAKKAASKPVKSGPVNKFDMDIGELFGKNRKYYIDLISVHFSNPVFRAELKEYVRAKGKKTHSELEDMHLQDFFMSIESAVSK